MSHVVDSLIAPLAVAILASVGVAALAGSPQQTWLATWAASPQAADPDPQEPLVNIAGQTVRERVRISLDGAQLRLRLSNEHGATPLVIGSATVALSSDSASVKSGSMRSVTFGGRRSVTIPAGAPMLSDAVALRMEGGAQLSVSVYFPERVTTPTLHALALKRCIVTPPGDFTRADHVETQGISESSILVSAVLVPARPGQRLIVAFGDSVTDGDASTVDADRSWPSDLERRFAKRGANPGVAVVNEGIAGNRLLANGFGFSFGLSGLARFDRDVLTIPGVTHVVLLEGLNDLGFPGAKIDGRDLASPSEARTAADLIGAYLQLIARAHVRGIKIIGATLTPFEGVDVPGYYSESKEAARQAVNTWIRSAGAFDGVIDFDAVLRDSDHPSRMQARYASHDHLHPTDLGYQAMADAIDLSLFQSIRSLPGE
jgi:lysophospholipase L1-like esterase